MQETIDLHSINELAEIEIKDGLRLRLLEESDASQILQILDDDPTIRSRVSIAMRMIDEVSFLREITLYKADKDVIRYAISDGDQVIGLMSFWRLGTMLTNYIPGSHMDSDTYGFGYFIHPSMRNKGIVSGALEKLVELAKECVQPKKLIAFCEDNNPASIRVLEKSGFRATDTIVHFPVDGTSGYNEREYNIIL